MLALFGYLPLAGVGLPPGGEGVPFGPLMGPRGTKMGVFDALGPAIGPKGTLKPGETPGVTYLQGRGLWRVLGGQVGVQMRRGEEWQGGCAWNDSGSGMTMEKRKKQFF